MLSNADHPKYIKIWSHLPDGVKYKPPRLLIVIWQLPLMEQELITLQKLQSSMLGFRAICVARSLVFCIMFCRSLYVLFCPFLLAIVSYVLLRLMASDYSFGILKPFVKEIHISRSFVFCAMFCRSCDINCSIFLAVQKYIKNTCRFSMSWS